jgi:hypothetical protein
MFDGWHVGARNRTHTISLGIGQIVADKTADQPTLMTGSSRDWPLMTMANCTTICAFQARHIQYVRSMRGCSGAAAR